MMNLTVEKTGRVLVDAQPVSFPELFGLLTNRYSVNTNLPVYITGTRDTTHGAMMYVLDFVRRAGVQRVAIASKHPRTIHKPAMKNFQQNLLIVLALSLCGLCVYQWYDQTVQRNRIERLNEAVYEKTTAIQGYTNSIKTMDTNREDEHGACRQRAAAKTNEQLIGFQRVEINKLQLGTETLTNRISEYKQAVDLLETKLREAYAGIQKQNDALKELAAQRDEFVKKFNDKR